MTLLSAPLPCCDARVALGHRHPHADRPTTSCRSSSDAEDIDTEEAAAASRPIMRVPFACGQTWVADTRSNHSPVWAVDFNRTNDFGDTVVASAGGEVTRVDNEGNSSYGRWIEIGHGNGWRTRYAHLSVQSVHVGQKVKMGQKIGEVGSTGGSSGPHLHYEQLTTAAR